MLRAGGITTFSATYSRSRAEIRFGGPTGMAAGGGMLIVEDVMGLPKCGCRGCDLRIVVSCHLTL